MGGAGERPVGGDAQRGALPAAKMGGAERCAAAGVPEERRELRTKPALALEILKRARANGVRFSWVAADGTYGQDRTLLRALDDAVETFVIDVHRDQQMFLEEPPARSCRARATEEVKPIRVDRWAAQEPAEAWQKHWVRHSTRGELQIEAVHRRVWVREGREETPRQ